MTARSTVDALLYALRRGLKCLDDPDNMRRLGDCDNVAMTFVVGELRQWDPATRHWLRLWHENELRKLTVKWRRERERRKTDV